MESNNLPEKHVKFGGVRVSIWKNVRTGKNGKSFKTHTVKVDRAYTDANGEWHNTGNLKENDIPKAITALQKAFEYITEREVDNVDQEIDTVPEEQVKQK